MSVTIKGLDEAINQINKKIDGVVDSVKTAMSDAAQDIELSATRDAPSQWEGIPLNIKQRIYRDVEQNGLVHKVGVTVPTSGEQFEAWIEFGTGLSAEDILGRPEYSAEIRAVARTFFRNGKGRIVGQPYLMPAFFRNTANLPEEIVKQINNDLK